jgi:hypothetical protein
MCSLFECCLERLFRSKKNSNENKQEEDSQLKNTREVIAGQMTKVDDDLNKSYEDLNKLYNERDMCILQQRLVTEITLMEDAKKWCRRNGYDDRSQQLQQQQHNTRTQKQKRKKNKRTATENENDTIYNAGNDHQELHTISGGGGGGVDVNTPSPFTASRERDSILQEGPLFTLGPLTFTMSQVVFAITAVSKDHPGVATQKIKDRFAAIQIQIKNIDRIRIGASNILATLYEDRNALKGGITAKEIRSVRQITKDSLQQNLEEVSGRGSNDLAIEVSSLSNEINSQFNRVAALPHSFSPFHLQGGVGADQSVSPLSFQEETDDLFNQMISVSRMRGNVNQRTTHPSSAGAAGIPVSDEDEGGMNWLAFGEKGYRGERERERDEEGEREGKEEEEEEEDEQKEDEYEYEEEKENGRKGKGLGGSDSGRTKSKFMEEKPLISPRDIRSNIDNKKRVSIVRI